MANDYGTRIFSDAELLALPWLVVGHNHFRNPFAHVVGEPIGSENARRWCIVHGEIADPDAPVLEPDPFEDLLMDTTIGPSPMNQVGGGAPGYGYALFPNVPASPSRAYQDEWEVRAREMHANQGRIDPSSMEERVRENPMQRAMLARGD